MPNCVMYKYCDDDGFDGPVLLSIDDLLTHTKTFAVLEADNRNRGMHLDLIVYW